jgi:hypothetical protein
MTEVAIKVTGTNAAGPALLGASAEIKKIGEEAGKSERKLTAVELELIKLRAETRRLGDEFTKTGDKDVFKKFNESLKQSNQLEKFAKDFDDVSKRVGNDFATEVGKGVDKAKLKTKEYAHSIEELEQMAKSLGMEFQRTGDIDVLKKFKEVTKSKKDLEGFGKDFDNLFDDVGKGFPGRLKNLISEGFQSAGELDLIGPLFSSPQVTAAIASSAVAAAPAIATLIGGAIELAAGGAFLGIGIMEAVKDQRVATALQALKRDIGDELQGATAPFRQEMIQTTTIFDKSFAAAGPGLKQTFSALAKEVTPLADALSKMALEALPGVEEAARGSAPILHELAQDAPMLGHAIGDFFHDVSSSGPAAATIFHGILVSVESLIEGLGIAIKQGSLFFDMSIHPQNIGKDIAALGDLGSHLDEAGHKLGDGSLAADDFSAALTGTSSATKDLVSSSSDAATALAALNEQFDKAVNDALSLNDQLAANTLNLEAVKEAFKKNGKSIDENTLAGARNVQVIDQLIAGYEQQRQKAIAAGDGSREATNKANSAYNDQLGKLQALLVKLGLSKQAAAEFMDQFKNKDVTISVHVKVTQTGPVSVQGVVSGGVPLHGAYRHGGNVGGAASGGLRSGLTWVGEDGPELMDMSGLAGAQIYTNGDSKRMASGGSQGMTNSAQSGPTSLVMEVAPGAEPMLVEFLINLFRRYIQFKGGDGSVLGITTV